VRKTGLERRKKKELVAKRTSRTQDAARRKVYGGGAKKGTFRVEKIAVSRSYLADETVKMRNRRRRTDYL